MSKHKVIPDPTDRSIPGYAELSTWPKLPGSPEEILGIWLYRDGGTVGVTIKGKIGKDIELFFDRVLGRLCYGKYHTDDDAAFIKKGSDFETEVYEYLEIARKKLNTHVFLKSDIKLFNDCFKEAKVYTQV
ncbi:MAG: hypothetical protein COB04_18625 [Gammaproteobacteria bacterium]|nr:MAG: hypothetical protein COB04_18625 [Gammaproteobacteria bacterium]